MAMDKVEIKINKNKVSTAKVNDKRPNIQQKNEQNEYTQNSQKPETETIDLSENINTEKSENTNTEKEKIDVKTRTQYAYDPNDNTKQQILNQMEQIGLTETEYETYETLIDSTIKKEEDNLQFTKDNELRLVELYMKRDPNSNKYENAKELYNIIYSNNSDMKLNFISLTGENSEERTLEIWEELYAEAKELSPTNQAFTKENYSELTEEEKINFVKEYSKIKLEKSYEEERKRIYEEFNEIDINGNKGGIGLYKKATYNELTEEEKIEFLGRQCEQRYSQLTFSIDDVKEWEADDSYLDKMSNSIVDREMSIKQLKYRKKEVEMQAELFKIEKVVYTDDYKNYTEKGLEKYIATYSLENATLLNINELDIRKYLNSEQIKILDYIYNNQGKEKADEYVYALRGQIAKGQGIEEANAFLKSIESDPEKKSKLMEVLQDKAKFNACLIEGGIDGIGTFGEGIKNLFTGDDYELSALEWKEQVIMEVLSTNEEYSNGWCDKAYQYGNVIGNLAPSMLATAAVTTATGGAAAPEAFSFMFSSTGQLAGTLSMALSAAGNAKHQALVNGASLTSAWTYGICSGLSEATMERFLGSIPGLSRLEGGYLKKMVAEGLEEGSQEIVSGVLNQVILGEDIEIDSLIEQTKESGTMGAAVSALLNIGSIKSLNINLKYNGKTVKISEQLQKTLQEEIDKINNGEIDKETGNQNAINILETELQKQVGKENMHLDEKAKSTEKIKIQKSDILLTSSQYNQETKNATINDLFEQQNGDIRMNEGIINKFIGKKDKIEVNKGAKRKLVLDDIDCYNDFMKYYKEQTENEQKVGEPFKLFLIDQFIDNYFSNNNQNSDIIDRMVLYNGALMKFKYNEFGDSISIKYFKNTGVAECAEKAALAHNLAIIAGLDSSFVAGEFDYDGSIAMHGSHAYNLIKSKSQDCAILYDPQNPIKYINGKKAIEAVSVMPKDEYKNFLEGKQYKFDFKYTMKQFNEDMSKDLDLRNRYYKIPSKYIDSQALSNQYDSLLNGEKLNGSPIINNEILKEIDLLGNDYVKFYNYIKNLETRVVPSGYNNINEYKQSIIQTLINSGKINEFDDSMFFQLLNDKFIFKQLLNTEYGREKIAVFYAKNIEKNSELLIERIDDLDIEYMNKLFNLPDLKAFINNLPSDEFGKILKKFRKNENVQWVNCDLFTNKILNMDIEDFYQFLDNIGYAANESIKIALNDDSRKDSIINFLYNIQKKFYSENLIMNNPQYYGKIASYLIPYENSTEYIRKNIDNIDANICNQVKDKIKKISDFNFEIDKYGDLKIKVDDDYKYYDMSVIYNDKERTIEFENLNGYIDFDIFKYDDEITKSVLSNSFNIKSLTPNIIKSTLKLTSEDGLKPGLNKVTLDIDGSKCSIVVNSVYDSINIYDRINENAKNVKIISIENMGNYDVNVNDGKKIYLMTYKSEGVEHQKYILAEYNWNDTYTLKINNYIEKNNITDIEDLNIVDVSKEHIKQSINSDIFNRNIFSDIKYGGNQSDVNRLVNMSLNGKPLSPVEVEKAAILNNLIEKYFSGATDINKSNLAYYYSNSGCVYMAFANAFANYMSTVSNGEEIFKNRFGFDLVTDVKGEKSYNIEAIAFDMYLNYISKKSNGNVDNIDFSESGGVSPFTREEKIDDYFKSKNIKISIEGDVLYGKFNKNKLYLDILNNKDSYHMLNSSLFDLKIDSQFKNNLENAFNVDMALSNSTTLKDIEKDVGGHCMFITGINDDMNFEVSSWSKKYEYLCDSVVKNIEANKDSDAFIWSVKFDI